MINKKFASAVGLGATAIGAAGSTMTSANLFDLLKNDKKAQDEYLKETIKVRNRDVAKNIIKEMLRLLNYGSNNTSDLIEKLKDAVDSKKIYLVLLKILMTILGIVVIIVHQLTL